MTSYFPTGECFDIAWKYFVEWIANCTIDTYTSKICHGILLKGSTHSHAWIETKQGKKHFAIDFKYLDPNDKESLCSLTTPRAYLYKTCKVDRTWKYNIVDFMRASIRHDGRTGPFQKELRDLTHNDGLLEFTKSKKSDKEIEDEIDLLLKKMGIDKRKF